MSKKQKVSTCVEKVQEQQNVQVLSSELSSLIFYFKTNQWIMKPDYQRQQDIWPHARKEDLIQTVFEKRPIHPLLILQIKKCKKSLYDGLQRMSSLISFYDNNLRVINHKIAECYYKNKTETHVRYEDLNEEGKNLFKSYTVCYFTLFEMPTDNYFSRVNYTLLQSVGEKLHSIGSPVSKQICRLLENIPENCIECEHDSGKRMKLFERMAILLYIKVTGEEVQSTYFGNLEQFVSSSNPISPQKEKEMIEDLKSHHIPIHEKHLIPLLLSNYPRSQIYDQLCEHKFLKTKFTEKLKSNGTNYKNIKFNVDLFNSLFEMFDINNKDVTWNNMKIIMNYPLTENEYPLICMFINYQKENRFQKIGNERELEKKCCCDICHNNVRHVRACQNGVLSNNLNTDLVKACFKCSDMLAIYNNDQIKEFLMQ